MGSDLETTRQFACDRRIGWRPLVDGDEWTVLALDCELSARPIAGFPDFAPLLPVGCSLWQGVHPPVTADGSASAEAYLRWWSFDPPSPPPVTAVLGFCSGSVFAAALANRIADRQGTRPSLILLDPGRPDRMSLEHDFRRAVIALATLSEQEHGALTARVTSELDRWGGDFGGMVDSVVAAYEWASRVAFERAGIDLSAGAELVSVFDSYTRYLRAAQSLATRPEWSPAITILSADRDPLADITGTVIRTGVRRDDLLRSREIAGLFRDILLGGVER
ncbi:hypothetical protein [Nocardia sp. NPDC057668]|uniref:hypothetical protein n=1 Tax=Nocardia sp. NPDC057668 TaxID=3346202 RepID=UPI00366F05DA